MQWDESVVYDQKGFSINFHEDFLKGTEHSRVAYNEAIAKLTGWGYLVIGVPCLVIWLVAWWLLVRKLKEITGLETDQLTVVG